MRKLRVGIVAVGVRQGAAGSNEAYLRGLLKGLASLRTDDTIFHVYCPDAEVVQDAIGENNECFELHVTPRPPGKFAAYATRILHETRIGLSGAHDVLLLTGTSLALFARRPQVMVAHWDARLQPHSSPPIQARVNQLMLMLARTHARKIIVPTAAYGRHLQAAFGLPADAIVAVHHGVTAPPIDEPVRKEAHHAVAVTNDLPHKNLPSLLQAWDKVQAVLPDACLTLVGRVRDAALDASGVDWRRWEAIGSLRRSGWMDHADVMRLVAASSLLISTSEGETFCLPLLEGMSAGTAVLTADTDVAREVCGDAAAYFPLRDSETLTHSILKLMADEAELQRLADAGRIRARGFSWTECGANTLAVLQRAASSVRQATEHKGREYSPWQES